ncbi:DUF2358 domain-containing protein [Lusitaniella coriacea]|uniref:DUF2358 domain-containing protein n=1 Tax=Lusitaniella coriacea TaxID=1983105 RepID=UPI003CE711BB
MKTSTTATLNEADYQTQIRQVITTLQADLPTLFERDISYAIYTQDIAFSDPISAFKGKLNYRIIFWTLRFHARLFFESIYFDVHSIQQTEKEIIQVHWTVRGKLRLPWQANLLFNGDSTYRLNGEGLIYDHCDRWDRKPTEILKQFLPARSREN